MGSQKETRGVAPLTAQREEFARLIARGVSNSEACRLVGVNRRTGTRWRLGGQPDRASGRGGAGHLAGLDQADRYRRWSPVGYHDR
jgi:hypothetical protein